MNQPETTPSTMPARKSSSITAVAHVVVFLMSVLFGPAATQAAEEEIPWNKDTQDATLICMGPIGARAKTDRLLVNLPESQNNSGTINYIFKNSLAEGKLELGDVVTGVNGESFQGDFSRRLAAAIDWSEGNTGILELSILRDDTPLSITFDIPRIGSFSTTFPYNCKKSDRILESACEWLVRHQASDGSLSGKENDPNCVCTAVGGLALLGSGDPKYAKNTELIAKNLLDYFKKYTSESDGHFRTPASLEGWQLMYGAMFLSEYYLATQDARVPETLNFLNKEIEHLQYRTLEPEVLASMNDFLGKKVKNQDPLVPPYWFAHMRPSQNKIGGYMHLGANVANALLVWRLLAECGVPVDVDNCNKTRDYVEIACPTGEMGYAPWPNQPGGDLDSFGRTGVLGMAYYLRNDHPEFRGKISSALQRHYEQHYYTSHSSAVMGKTWGTIALAAIDPTLFRQTMDHFKYDYSLIRLNDGSFVANPAHWADKGHPQCDLRGAYGYGHRWTTAFNALIFALGKKNLRILGAAPHAAVSQDSTPDNP